MRPQLTPSQDDRERKAQKVIIRTRAELAAPSPPVDLGNQSNNLPLQLNGSANTSYITAAYTNESSSVINIPKEKKKKRKISEMYWIKKHKSTLTVVSLMKELGYKTP